MEVYKCEKCGMELNDPSDFQELSIYDEEDNEYEIYLCDECNNFMINLIIKYKDLLVNLIYRWIKGQI